MDQTTESSTNYSRNLTLFLQVLNILCIVPCIVMKVPQVSLLWRSKKTTGLSLMSILLEFYVYTVHFLYFFINEYALMSYVEYTFLLVQDVMLIAFYLFFNDMIDARVFISTSLYTFGSIAIATGITPVWLPSFLLSVCLPISVSSKGLQIRAIINAGDSSRVSLVTWAIAFLTTLGRMITLAFDKGDQLVMFGYLVGMCLNFLVCCAIIYYKPSPKKFK
ncbi:solute carrier family 66 member 3-like [Apostichopus japonicus]|uniref:solute carrier family 66 member 3-like n=1 Tax=Stichopus japonicus TaxID=307972 RepID=UPI003AB754BE